ncbi:WD40 repeat-like protein, partial [Meira miltonrushii]
MLFWLGESSTGWIKDPLARLTFASPITSHDINQQTRSPNRLDVIIAFKTSDLVWLEAISMRYSRINKAGCINDAPITSVRWLPGSETLFLTTHNDGTCTLFDITRDDSTTGSWAPAIHAWEPSSGILVTRPAATENETQRKAWMKLNPVAHWRIARNKSITDMAFSPDHTKLALVSTDGSLRLVNLLTESLEGTFQSYYGAMNRVIWSPDAKFLLTAGCDDLISIWTSDGRLLSRCPGHSSFVTGIAFDPWKWKVEDRTYRFVSVGEDGRVFLWDFSSAALHRPR